MIFSLFLVADATRVTKHSFLGTEESALKESYPAPPPADQKVNQPETTDGAVFGTWLTEIKATVYDPTMARYPDLAQVEEKEWPYYAIYGDASDIFKNTNEYKQLVDFGVYYSKTPDGQTRNAAEEKIKARERFGAVPEAHSHRAYIQKVYDSCPKLFPNVKQEQLDVHDLSKFEFLEAVGYTCHWGRGETCYLPEGGEASELELATKRRAHDTLLRRESAAQFRYGYDYYEAALQHHYDKNNHHPEYYQNNGKFMIDPKYMEEMVADKMAAIWERSGQEHQTLRAFLTAIPGKTTQYPYWLPYDFFSRNMDSANMEGGRENKDFVNELVKDLKEKCGVQRV